MTHLRIACIQVNAQLDMEANVEEACSLVREAADAGADLIGLPENVALMAASEEDRLEMACRPADHPALAAFAALAREKDIWLQAGSVAALRADGTLANHAFLFGPDGEVADYEKIHMFDVDLPDGSRYRESAMFHPGETAVLAPTPWGLLGMTVRRCSNSRCSLTESLLFRRLRFRRASRLSFCFDCSDRVTSSPKSSVA